MQSKNTIEVNGRRYDAATGALLGTATSVPVKSGQNVDGFFRERKKTSQASEAIKVRVAVKPKPALHSAPKSEAIIVKKLSKKPESAPQASHARKVLVHAERTVNHAKAHIPSPTTISESRQQLIARRNKQRIINHAKAHAPQITEANTVRKPSVAYRKHKLMNLHSPANHTKARTAQDSTTLMRSAVKRPAPSLRKQAGAMGALRRSMPSLIVAKSSAHTVDDSRLTRAQKTGRSPLIAHHASPVGHAIRPTIAPLAVQPVPVKPEGEVPNTIPAPNQPTNKPSTPTDIFEHALANASNYVDVQVHRAHLKKQARRHMTSMAAGTLALLVIAGFAAYQNTPGLQFKVASIHAGVSTSMPNLHAAGFAYNGVHAANGALTVGFTNTDGSYQLTQTNTNLSSSDMIQSISATDASGTPNYRTLQAGATTVYRFDNTGATWISGGKWYTVSGNSALSDSQVESIIRNS